MKLLTLLRFFSLAAAFVLTGWPQTQVDLRTQSKAIDFSSAGSTMPSETGAVLPASCQVGATFILTSTIAGQNWYICTSANEWTVQGTAVPAQTGNTGAVLSTNGASLSWNAFGGDVSGAPGAISVKKLLGRPLNLTAPLTGQFLGWDGTQWTAQTAGFGGSGAVSSIFGRVGTVTAQTGDYSFSQISGSVLNSQLPSAGGDLTGSLASATVARLQGNSVASSTPATGQVLTWSGTQWTPQNPTGGVASVFGRVGVIAAQTGDYSAAQITNAADVTRSNSFAAGARQIFNGGVNGAGLRLPPAALPSAPLTGDLAVDSGDSNRLKVYSGSAWITLNPAASTANYTASFTSAAVVSITGATHGLGTANLIVQCYDNSSPSNWIEPSQIAIDPVTYNVTITFAAAQTGRCVLNGYNGVSGVNSGNSGGTTGGASMASQLGDFAVSLTDASNLSIGANCSVATPCNVRFGTQTYSFTNPATATITGGSGMAYIYVDTTGALTVGSSMTLNCSVYCVTAPGIGNFPLNSIPLYTWTAANGAWDANGGLDRRGWLNMSPVLGGAGIAAITTAGQTTIAVDGAVVPTYLSASATLDFPMIAAGACAADLTFSLPGANAGDAVAPGWPAALPAGLSGTMRISAAGVVSVRLCADTTGAVNPVAATFTATVVRGF